MPELIGISFNTLGGGPPRIVTLREAKRSSAGVLILKNYQAGLCNKVSRPSLLYLYQACVTNCPGHFLKVPAPSKMEQNLPTTFQNPPQTLPKSTQNRSKWFLGAYLGPMFQKSFILKVQGPAKKRPRDSPERPKPLPNRAQDPPKSTF